MIKILFTGMTKTRSLKKIEENPTKMLQKMGFRVRPDKLDKVGPQTENPFQCGSVGRCYFLVFARGGPRGAPKHVIYEVFEI